MALDYEPSEDFIVNNLQPLVDFDLTGSKELWLIQCPISQFPEIEGKEFKVKLDKDGILGGFEDSSGNEVDLVSFASQDVDAAVIIPSQEDSRIVGKISRRVSLVRYPEPKELVETVKAKTQQKLVGAVTNSSGKFSALAKSSRAKSGQSGLRHSASTRSSRQKSFMSSLNETPMPSKRKHSETSSGKHHGSTSTVSGSSDRSGKSKKKVKTEEKKKVKTEEK
uniref:Mediator-associated protein 2 n=1 Tax=Noccaea caerulescens TaxID=107243 RepID=A0A1J3I8V6_NOCCA